MGKLLPLLAMVSLVAAAEYDVAIEGFAFDPDSLNIEAGDTVTWTNYDTVPHTATADDASWDSGTLNQGDSWSDTFVEEGTETYHCEIHPSMTATIIVEDLMGIEKKSWGEIKTDFE